MPQGDGVVQGLTKQEAAAWMKVLRSATHMWSWSAGPEVRPGMLPDDGMSPPGMTREWDQDHRVQFCTSLPKKETS